MPAVLILPGDCPRCRRKGLLPLLCRECHTSWVEIPDSPQSEDPRSRADTSALEEGFTQFQRQGWYPRVLYVNWDFLNRLRQEGEITLPMLPQYAYSFRGVPIALARIEGLDAILEGVVLPIYSKPKVGEIWKHVTEVEQDLLVKEVGGDNIWVTRLGIGGREQDPFSIDLQVFNALHDRLDVTLNPNRVPVKESSGPLIGRWESKSARLSVITVLEEEDPLLIEGFFDGQSLIVETRRVEKERLLREYQRILDTLHPPTGVYVQEKATMKLFLVSGVDKHTELIVLKDANNQRNVTHERFRTEYDFVDVGAYDLLGDGGFDDI